MDFAAAGGVAKSIVDQRAVMTGDKVVQILDETVDWYRMLGIQQQAATQPSDLLILYANRQTAEKVMALAFEIARANAELLSSEAGAAQASEDAASSQSLGNVQKKLDAERTSIQAEIDAAKRDLASPAKGAGGKNSKGNADLQARISVLQGELDIVNARRNMISNMTQYAAQNDTNGFGANSLKAHIDAIAASIPSTLPAAPAAAQVPAATSSDSDSSALSLVANTSLTRFGIWDLTATVLRLSAKARTIDTVDQRTAELQKVLDEIRMPPVEQLKVLSARADALAAQADAGTGTGAAELKAIRDQYDTVAWLFQQTSSIVIPLSKVDVLLKQYRHNLNNWREATDRQYRDALSALGWRLALFGGLLVLVFVIADLWKRAAFRYVHDARRRSRLLLLRRIVFWVLVIVIASATFVTELGSLATFAGLITAEIGRAHV